MLTSFPALALGAGVTVIVIILLVTVFELVQADGFVRITFTRSLLFKVAIVNVVLFVPTFTPFICHWYKKLDAELESVAVNKVTVPEQIVLLFVAIVTVGVIFPFTDILIVLLIPVVLVAHVGLPVRITFTRSLLFNIELVKLLLFVPTFTPLICH